VIANRAIETAQRALEIEAEAVYRLRQRLDDGGPESTSDNASLRQQFLRACQLMFGCTGRVIATGIGKSGHIANKIASTLASTGTPAFFLHPAEASHGDLGMVTGTDVVLALSHSGQTAEILRILPLIKRRGAGLVAITGDTASPLAQQADAHLHIDVDREACPLNLAPTASTTAALAMGDAIAVTLLDARGFDAEQFALSHPGGALGRRLLTLVADLMRTGDAVPRVRPEAGLREAIVEMTRKRLGMTAVIDTQGRAVGIFTDGDLRRTFEQRRDADHFTMRELMQPAPVSLRPQALASEAARLMQARRITQVLVSDADGVLVGALNVHDLLQAGVM
jgi:arabinose-5-phosphate isomerase